MRIRIILLQRANTCLVAMSTSRDPPATRCMDSTGKQSASKGELRSLKACRRGLCAATATLDVAPSRRVLQQEAILWFHATASGLGGKCLAGVKMYFCGSDLDCALHNQIALKVCLCNHFLCQESEKGCEKAVNKLFRHWNLTLWNPYSVAQCDTAGAHLSGDWSLCAVAAQNTDMSIVWGGCAPGTWCGSGYQAPCTPCRPSALQLQSALCTSSVPAGEKKGFRSFETVREPFDYIFFQRLYKIWFVNIHNACEKIYYYNSLLPRPGIFVP